MEKGISLADTPVIGVVEVKDRNSSQHSDPFHKFFNAQKFAGIHLFFTCDPRKPCKFFSCKQYYKIRPVPWRLSCVDRAKSILKRK